MSTLTSPVPSSERAMILDILRGFAILGILLDNIFGFSGYGFLSFDQMKALPTWPADGILGLAELAFVHGKFYSLFSLLFGIGFSIILMRNEQKGVNALKIFYRRLFILLLIGAAHLYFLWPGDILFLYAIIGFFLPLFRNFSNRALLITAAVLIFSPVLIDLVKVLLQVKTGVFLERVGERIDQQNGINNSADVLRFLYAPASGFKEFWDAQQSGFFFRYAYIIESNRIPKVLGMFLVGFYVGRNMLYMHLAEYRNTLKKIRKWGFIIGIPASLAMAYFEIDDKHVPSAVGLLDTLAYAISVVPLSLAYTISIALWWQKHHEQSAWRFLAPVGRMALTNYIMHTILCITIFYAVGFELGGNVGPTVFFPIALAIYGFQVIFCNWWFWHFEYGPLEWLWRQLTYGKKLPLKKKVTLATTPPMRLSRKSVNPS